MIGAHGVSSYHERGKVWWWNGEDPFQELQRRIEAACLWYGIPPEETEGRLFVDSGRDMPIIVASETRNGVVIAEPVTDALKETIRRNGIDVFRVDPFVSSHRVSENDNMKIEAVASQYAKIAGECNCAIELVHHARKTGGQEVTPEHARGASALHDKARAVRALNRMTEEEGASAGVGNYRLFFRVDDGKPNMAPPSDAATWYKLESVNLGNRTDKRPGDEIGVVVSWSWPDDLEGLPDDALPRVRGALGNGKWRKDPQSFDWIGKPIAAALGLDLDTPRHKAQVKTLIREWGKLGVFIEVPGHDKKSNPRMFIELAQEFEPIDGTASTP